MSDQAFPSESDTERSLGRKEAAAYLGISEPFLKKLDLSRRGPVAYRFGRRWTYRKLDLDVWREAHRYDPAQDCAVPLDLERALRPEIRLQRKTVSEADDPTNRETKETERR